MIGDPEPRTPIDARRNERGGRERRQVLRSCGALGLAALAGCTSQLDAGGGATGDTRTVPALYVYSRDHDDVFTSDAIGDYASADMDALAFEHVDTDAFRTTLTDDEFTLAFTGAVTRPVTVAVNLAGPGLPYDERDPPFLDRNPVALTTSLEATVTEEAVRSRPPADLLERHTVAFDLGGVDLPRNTSIHADVCLQDPLTDRLRIMAHHGALPLAYTIDGGERLRWFDESAVVKHGEPTHVEPASGYHASFEESGHRIAYGIHEQNGHRWAAGAALDVEAMEAYADHGDTGWFPHALAAANTAHENPVMRQLARRLWDAIEDVGVTDPLGRLDALVDYVQTLPYRIPEDGDRKPTYTLYSGSGDCSERTFLFGGVLRCEPWTTRVGYIYCQRDGVNHTVPAIHLDEVRDTALPTDSLYTVRPSDLPRTIDDHRHADDEFVFTEVTGSRDQRIGEFDPETYELEYFYGTNFWSAHEW